MKQSDSIIDDTLLLLTASINPNGMPGAILDSGQRLQDYKAAFSYYLENHPRVSKILFAENSGWPLDELKELCRSNPHNKQVEFLSLDINHFPREFGKGYGELNLITSALEQSTLARETRYVAKVTGRLFITNLSQVLEKIRGNLELQCDLRDHPLYEWLLLPYCGRQCDTRLIVFTPSFFETHLKHLIAGHEHGEFCIEHEFYRTIKLLDDGKKIRCRFPVEAIYSGLAGHNGKNYSGKKELFKQTVRGLCRKVCPWLRI